jgi:hypothetical protein
MARLIHGLFGLGLGVALFAGACSDTRPVGPIRDGLAECESMGKLCHDPGVRLGGRYEECHDIGHENVGEECLAHYDECASLCKAAPEGGTGGAGGEGGAGDSHGGTAGTTSAGASGDGGAPGASGEGGAPGASGEGGAPEAGGVGGNE